MARIKFDKQGCELIQRKRIRHTPIQKLRGNDKNYTHWCEL